MTRTLPDDQILLNSWAAEQLHAKPGDMVRIAYFEPESVAGRLREKSVSLRLAGIAGTTDAQRSLVPPLPGVTDRSTMADWTPPFPFDIRRIRPVDERYWREHGAAPKAFVSLATGRRLWSSRFGQSTSIFARRLPKPLTLDPVAMGFVFQPLKRQSLAASAGSTPFDVLFLAFSSFLIVAAVMLAALLMRLAVERRAAEIGILLAVGFSRRQVARLLAAEGLIIAMGGSILGVAMGVGYAAILVTGLNTWWRAAVTTPFLHLYATPRSLAIGFGVSTAAAMLAILLTARRITRVSPRRLLAGETSEESYHIGVVNYRLQVPLSLRERARVRGTFTGAENRVAESPPGSPHPGPLPEGEGDRLRETPVPPRPGRGSRKWAISWALALLAFGPALAMAFAPIRQDVQVGAFFAAGAISLVSLLALAGLRFLRRRGWLGDRRRPRQPRSHGPAQRRPQPGPQHAHDGLGRLGRLPYRFGQRISGRSVPARAFVARPKRRLLLGGPERSADLPGPQLARGTRPTRLLRRRRAAAGRVQDRLLRVQGGDDASCLNLYRPRQPRVLGVPRQLVEHDGFAWADAPKGCRESLGTARRARAGPSAGHSGAEHRQLRPGLVARPRPVATRSADFRGQKLRLRVAALLADSLFQGDLLVGEETLLAFDPETSGYRFFLIETPPAKIREVQEALERTLGDYGFATETAAARLAGFAAVQNTYLSTFQSLAALGLLLGTAGLAAVQLRNVLERRGELALLRATGFRRRTLAALVIWENMVLLGLGLACGCLAAAVAVLPQLLHRGVPIPWASLAGTMAIVLASGGSPVWRQCKHSPMPRSWPRSAKNTDGGFFLIPFQ